MQKKLEFVIERYIRALAHAYVLTRLCVYFGVRACARKRFNIDLNKIKKIKTFRKIRSFLYVSTKQIHVCACAKAIYRHDGTRL